MLYFAKCKYGLFCTDLTGYTVFFGKTYLSNLIWILFRFTKLRRKPLIILTCLHRRWSALLLIMNWHCPLCVWFRIPSSWQRPRTDSSISGCVSLFIMKRVSHFTGYYCVNKNSNKGLAINHIIWGALEIIRKNDQHNPPKIYMYQYISRSRCYQLALAGEGNSMLVHYK